MTRPPEGYLIPAGSNPDELAAIIITRPQLRASTITALAVDELGEVLQSVLGWVDELLLSRDADDIRSQLDQQATVALATTPEGLADLE